MIRKFFLSAFSGTLCITVTFLASSTLAGESEDIQLVEKWLDLEKQNSALQSAWSERKERLEQQLSLLQREQKAIEELIARSNSNKNEVSEQREELISQQNEFEQFDAKLSKEMDTLVSYVHTIKARLPTPLQQQWQTTLPSIENKPNSQKLESLLKIFKQAYDFDERVVFHTGLIELADSNETVLAEQVYLGLSQGWYVSIDQELYGYGRSDAAQWQWWHNQQANQTLNLPLSNEQVLSVTNILKQPTDARFIQLPLAIINQQGGKL
ncbi:DUF3450 family protein [Pseudoalteromonas luteoviolacea]|uniref:DUF3450 domain-containing protein n=1 Tax=Pseudoalteromonas luteoviolacea H33 TaxID=1365251 RepID=A0A167D8N8_9GAMM|nr:DUF3450 family protein [Pseudoalteromonas luteoviolacea]KZN48545.1 hypothetical protein N476_21975 [Pseudoalteromonas luteoviolacea H33]KZN73406.1 hypothetical protein N477_24075 [Pseudoalteromonas luteoviolacea H33-S]MBQ4876486.1 DUF3450 family protein [Pseudoalteromonas luteoviolacea]MBQ4905117.1 DUF3450 family protein [Pseudoalteromonas luteoviolacea]